MPAVTLADLKEWRQGSPDVVCTNGDLAGWAGDLGFICADDAARLTARGCFPRQAWNWPVWKTGDRIKKDRVCVLCGAKVNGGC